MGTSGARRGHGSQHGGLTLVESEFGRRASGVRQACGTAKRAHRRARCRTVCAEHKSKAAVRQPCFYVRHTRCGTAPADALVLLCRTPAAPHSPAARTRSRPTLTRRAANHALAAHRWCPPYRPRLQPPLTRRKAHTPRPSPPFTIRKSHTPCPSPPVSPPKF